MFRRRPNTIHTASDQDAVFERRLRAAELLAKGESQAKVARELGVSRQLVSRWARKIKRGGKELLLKRRPPGRPSKLSKEKWDGLIKAFSHLPAGDTSGKRELASMLVQQLSNERDTYHPDYVLKVLREKCQPIVPQISEV